MENGSSQVATQLFLGKGAGNDLPAQRQSQSSYYHFQSICKVLTVPVTSISKKQALATL